MILAYLFLFVCYLQDAGVTEGAEIVIWFTHSHSCTCFPDRVHFTSFVPFLFELPGEYGVLEYDLFLGSPCCGLAKS